MLRSVSHLTHSRRTELEHVDAAVRLRQGQCWIFELTGPQPPTVYEIMGFQKVQGELMVNLLAWQTTTPHRPIAPGDTVAMLETTHTGFHRGAGTRCFIPQARLGPRGTMVELSAERHSRVRASTRSTVVRCFPRAIAPMALVAPERTLHDASIPLRARLALALYTLTALTNRPAIYLTSSLRLRLQLRRQRSFSTHQMEITRPYAWISPTHIPRRTLLNW